MNGKELYYETEERFKYWYADGYGIHPTYDSRTYSDMSIEEALDVMADLAAIIEYCQQYQNEFADL